MMVDKIPQGSRSEGDETRARARRADLGGARIRARAAPASARARRHTIMDMQQAHNPGRARLAGQARRPSPIHVALGLVLLAGSGATGEKPPPRTTDGAGQAHPPGTMDGAKALGDLDREIASLERSGGAATAPDVGRQAELVDLLLERGQFRGRIADYERADRLASQMVAAAPADPRALLARARTGSVLHRFGEALADVERAEALPRANLRRVLRVRAAVFQATGRFAEAAELRRRELEAHATLETLGNEATLLGDLGDLAEAECRFSEAHAAARDASPLAVAWLDLQHGQMWQREGDLEQARELLAAAHERLPGYAAAAGQLGLLEAALGNRDEALRLLSGAMDGSDDPEIVGFLARVLRYAGRGSDASRLRARAAARYEALLADHFAAFAAHAAAFWLETGDPDRALALARGNLEVVRTPAAFALLARTAIAAGEGGAACSAAGSYLALIAPAPPATRPRPLSERGLLERLAAGCR